MPKHELTTEERRKGAHKAAEVKRERQQDARRLAARQIADLTAKSLQRLQKLLEDPSAAVAFRASREVLDRRSPVELVAPADMVSLTLEPRALLPPSYEGEAPHPSAFNWR